MISAFAGIETLLVTLLAMGASFFAISAETDEACQRSVARCFRNFQHFFDVTAVSVKDIVDILDLTASRQS